MGVARLLAKCWIVLCLYAGGHELHLLLFAGADPFEAIAQVGISDILFMAMGLLFITGYGVSRGGAFTTLKRQHLAPVFSDIVFALFAALSFANQTIVAPHFAFGGLSDAIEGAAAFAVPGQRALVRALSPCALDGGRLFASAVAWILAFVLLGSAVTRLRLAAGVLRLERNRRPEPLGGGVVALLYGVVAIVGIQMIFVGTAYLFTPCIAFTSVPGQVLIGLGPILLAYITAAALTALMATGSE